MKARLPQLVLVLACLVGGCGTMDTPVVNSRQSSSTAIASDEAVSIVLNRYRQCEDARKEDCWVDSSSASKERDFDGCVSKYLLKERPKLRILPAEEFRRVAFPDKEFLASPRSPEAIIELLSDAEFKRRVDSVHVRYLVVLDMETRNTAKDWDFDTAKGMASAVDRHWIRESRLKATVIDMGHALQVGVANAEVSGNAGYVVPFILIIPLPPIPYFSATESRACAELGQELGQKFFTTTDAAQAPK